MLAVFLLFAGCDDAPSAPPVPPAPPAIEEAAAEAPPTPSEWPAEIASLEESVRAFETTAECEAALRARVPVELSESFADLGYGRIFVETCTSLEAVRERSIERCGDIEVTALERGCVLRVAAITGDPDRCPSDPTRPGRDAKCIAWALRDPTLCRAARSGRDECEAVLANDVARCRAAPEEARGRCEAAVRRYGSSFAGERRASVGADLRPAARLRVRFVSIAREPLSIEAPLEHGVFAGAGTRCTHSIAIGEVDRVAGGAAFGDRPPSFALTFEVATAAPPIELPLGLTGARLVVAIPGLGVADSATGSSGNLTIHELGWERGAVLRAQIRGELSLVPGRVVVEGEIEAYVRDLDAPDCAE
jgi:hypothetical protein